MNLKNGIDLFKQYGLHDFTLRFMEWFDTKKRDRYYQNNIEKFLPGEDELNEQRKVKFEYAPLVSIVVPAYETAPVFLRQLVDSVLEQTYSNLELCIADGSNTTIVKDTLNEYKDERISYIKLSKNDGISNNTNEGFDNAKGEYIALLDHDDLLTPNALYEMVKELNAHDKIPDMVYSDEDKIVADTGKLINPAFKPDLNEEFLRHTNYICHFLMFSRELLDKVGGLNQEFDGAQDFEFVLRCNGAGADIKHVPKILYHWRIHPDSTAANPNSKLYAFENGNKAIKKYLTEIGEDGTTALTKDLGFYKIDYDLKGDYSVTVLANDEKQINEMKKKQREMSNLHIEYKVVKGQLSKEMEAVKTEYVVVADNDAIPMTDNWVEELLKYCQWKHVGITGVKCLNKNKKIESCGLNYDSNATVSSLFYHLPSIFRGYCHRADGPQNVMGVSLKLVMFRTNVIKEVGGINEKFSFPYRDLDVCFKIDEAGYDVILNTDVHVKLADNLNYNDEKSQKEFKKVWEDKLKKENKYYNANLVQSNGKFMFK